MIASQAPGRRRPGVAALFAPGRILYTRRPTRDAPAATEATAAMKASDVERQIQAGMPGCRVQVRSDDDTHFEAVVIAPQFAGKRPLQRHQLVYATLGAAVGREIHALSIQAHTPEEWASRGGA